MYPAIKHALSSPRNAAQRGVLRVSCVFYIPCLSPRLLPPRPFSLSLLFLSYSLQSHLKCRRPPPPLRPLHRNNLSPSLPARSSRPIYISVRPSTMLHAAPPSLPLSLTHSLSHSVRPSMREGAELTLLSPPRTAKGVTMMFGDEDEGRNRGRIEEM